MIFDKYDVIVVGCEPEGVTAAVSAARMGAKVLLIGQETSPGGLLVHGMLNTLDMNRKGDTLLTQGIFEEFYDYIGRTESFDVKKAEKFFVELIKKEPNLTYISNIKDFNPIVEEKVIKGIDVERIQLIEDIAHIDNIECVGCGFVKYCMSTRCKIVNKQITGRFDLASPVICAFENIIHSVYH